LLRRWFNAEESYKLGIITDETEPRMNGSCETR
jgi:hypothetical protein